MDCVQGSKSDLKVQIRSFVLHSRTTFILSKLVWDMVQIQHKNVSNGDPRKSNAHHFQDSQYHFTSLLL